MRSKVSQVRQEVSQKVKKSESLHQLEELISQNNEYFGDNAGIMLA